MKGLVWGIFGLAVSATASLAEPPAAIVNGTSVAAGEIERELKRMPWIEDRAKLTPTELAHHRRHALKKIVNEVLLRQFLDAESIKSDDKKVNDHIANLRDELAKKGQTLETFLQSLEVNQEKLRQDVQTIYRWFAYVEREGVEPVLRQYFDANKNAFDGTMVRASHILIKVEDGATPAEKARARKRIEDLRTQALAGAKFDDLARQHSDCPSKEAGGDLVEPFPRKGVMSEPFAAAAFDLKVGQISTVVESEWGYHLIVVTDRKPGKPIEFKEAVDDVKASYAEDLRVAVIAKMRAKAKIEYPIATAAQRESGNSIAK